MIMMVCQLVCWSNSIRFRGHIVMCCLAFAGVEAMLVQSSYTVFEGQEELMVCANLTGMTERPVQLTLSTESASAKGKSSTLYAARKLLNLLKGCRHYQAFQ